MSTTILEILLGALIAFASMIWLESRRKPKLEIEMGERSDVDYSRQPGLRPATRVRFLHLYLKNRQPPWVLRWLSREPATQCHGTITFHHLDGQNKFDRAMEIRWNSTPEPQVTLVTIEDGTRLRLVTPTINRVDVYPGTSREQFTVAGRFDDEEECYGWSNDSYLEENTWRPEKWSLPPERYLVSVNIRASNASVSAVYRLINDVPMHDFRLELAHKTDRIRDAS